MKVALIHHVPTGGAKRSIHDFARGLAARGHVLDEYRVGEAPDDFLPLTGIVRRTFCFAWRPWENRLPGGLGIRSLAHYPAGMRNQLAVEKVYEAMARACAQESYDMAYVAGCVISIVPSVTRHLRIPCVVYCQEPPRWGVHRSYGMGQRLKNALLWPFARAYFDWSCRRVRRNLAAAKKILVNSRYMQEVLARDWGLQAEICYHGIDPEKFRPGHAARGDYVLTVGALYPHKGFDFLIRALGLIAPGMRPRLMLLCDRGTRREQSFLQDLAQACGVRLDIHWKVSEQELLRRYQEALCFVYAPHGEPFGLAPLEAMACGTPVVAVAEGGMLETVAPGSGGVLTPRREADFADRVQLFLSDARCREEYSAKALSWVRERWSLEQAQQHFESMLLDAAAAGRS